MVDEYKLLNGLIKKRNNSLKQAIEIYTPYLSVVLFNLFGYSLSHEDAEEIISDVFVILWNNAYRIDLDKGTIRSYISASARNLALKKLKKQNDYIPIEEIDFKCTTNEAPCGDLSEIVWSLVMELGEPDNEIFVRYYKYGEKLREISKNMNINISTIKSKLSRGKLKLKKIMESTEGLL